MAQGLFLILILLTVTEITCNTYRKTNASTQIKKTKEGRKMKKTPAIEGIQNRLYVQYKNKTCLCLHDYSKCILIFQKFEVWTIATSKTIQVFSH